MKEDLLFDNMLVELRMIWRTGFEGSVYVNTGLRCAFNDWCGRRYFRVKGESLGAFERRIEGHLKVIWDSRVDGCRVNKLKLVGGGG